MTRTARRVAAFLLLAGLVVTGCGRAETAPGAAAIVGDETIDTGALLDVVSRGLAQESFASQVDSQPDGRAVYQRQQLSQLINRELLQAAADRVGAEPPPGEVDQQLAELESRYGSREALLEEAASGGIGSLEDLRAVLQDSVLAQAIGDRLTEDEEVDPEQLEALYRQNVANFNTAEIEQIVVSDAAEAQRILAEVRADPGRFAELAREVSIDDQTAERGGLVGTVRPGQLPPALDTAVFDAQPDSYFVAATEAGQHVVHVIARETVSLAEATPRLRRELLAEQRNEALTELLSETARRESVTVNPRFGRYEPEQAQVVAVEPEFLRSEEEETAPAVPPPAG